MTRTNLVLLALLVSLVVAACRAEPPKPVAAAAPEAEVVAGVRLVGRITHPHLTESSGLIGCSKDTNVFWTHNDGRRGMLYAITRAGRPVAEFPVAGVGLNDWEDIARDDQGHLYIGDIGNNDGKRALLAVHQIDEPDPKDSGKVLPVRRSWILRFSQAPFDCESLFIWQTNGYVISKVFNDAQAEIYRFPLAEQKEPFILEFVTRLPIESPVTGADISADGKKLGVVCKSGAFVFRIKGDVANAGDAKYHSVKFRDKHIEGCCFVPEGLLATAESREIYLFTDEAFRR